MCANCAGCSGDLLTPSPPAEQATACQDQAGQPGTGDGAGHRGISINTASARWSILPLDRALGVVPPQRERNGKYRHGASRSLLRRVGGASANDMIQKLFQSQNAGTIKID